jgi:ribonuclease Z
MARELVVLGCASQAPTRYRNHNGYFLRWDDEGILFDPGEGTQRQLLLAGVAASSISRICVTHFHGDHCLGLPGVFGRLTLDQAARTVDVYYPAAGQPYLDRLRHASVSDREPSLQPWPVGAAGEVDPGPPFRLVAGVLDHRTDTLGWRIEEPDGRHLIPEALAAAGVAGPDAGRLKQDGWVEAGGRRVRLEEVSEARPGQKMAFVMDTRWCDAAIDLAAGVDLLVCESTYLQTEAHLAAAYGHLTAAQAAQLAVEAGARRLVLTHYSQRHPDEQVFLEEAGPIFPDTVVVRDLDIIPVPPRRPTA